MTTYTFAPKSTTEFMNWDDPTPWAGRHHTMSVEGGIHRISSVPVCMVSAAASPGASRAAWPPVARR
jgi:hypothetical protein